MRNKVFKTLDEQIEILRSKGLTIRSDYETQRILFRENYFFLNGYRSMFMRPKHNRFIEGTTFEELYAVFCFDRSIRNIMFKNLLIVENNFKSMLSYYLSKKYGIKEKDYLSAKNLTSEPLKQRQVNDIINKMKRQIRNNIKQHTATEHYATNYGYIPLWVLVKVLSFGIVSEFYNVLKYEDKQSMARIYATDPETLGIYLNILSNFRNLCAHEDILYTHRTQRSIPDQYCHEYLNIEKKNDEYIYGKNDLFAVVIILKQMLEENQFQDFLGEIEYEIGLLDAKVDTVPLTSILNKIGFPDNWLEMEKDF